MKKWYIVSAVIICASIIIGAGIVFFRGDILVLSDLEDVQLVERSNMIPSDTMKAILNDEMGYFKMDSYNINKRTALEVGMYVINQLKNNETNRSTRYKCYYLSDKKEYVVFNYSKLYPKGEKFVYINAFNGKIRASK